MKAVTTHKRGFTLIELLVVMSIIGILASLGIASFGPIMEQVRKMKSQDNLKQMYKMLMLYSMQFGTYPSVQPNVTRYERGGGVRDLYPLYATGILTKDTIKILQAPGATLIPFTTYTIDEFDKNHIGYSYNSTCIPDDPRNPPLMAEQGVSTGVLDPNNPDNGRRPIFNNGAHVLFANGTVEFIPAVNGRLSTAKVKPEDWGKLLD